MASDEKGLADIEECENLDSIVDECFSFIDDNYSTCGSCVSERCDGEFNEVKTDEKDAIQDPPSSPSWGRTSDNVERVLNDHFAFLDIELASSDNETILYGETSSSITQRPLFKPIENDDNSVESVLDEHFNFLEQEIQTDSDYYGDFSQCHARELKSIASRLSPNPEKQDQENYQNVSYTNLEPIYSNLPTININNDRKGDINKEKNKSNFDTGINIECNSSAAVHTAGSSTLRVGCNGDSTICREEGKPISIPVTTCASEASNANVFCSSNEKTSTVYLNPNDDLISSVRDDFYQLNCTTPNGAGKDHFASAVMSQPKESVSMKSSVSPCSSSQVLQKQYKSLENFSDKNRRMLLRTVSSDQTCSQSNGEGTDTVKIARILAKDAVRQNNCDLNATCITNRPEDDSNLLTKYNKCKEKGEFCASGSEPSECTSDFSFAEIAGGNVLDVGVAAKVQSASRKSPKRRTSEAKIEEVSTSSSQAESENGMHEDEKRTHETQPKKKTKGEGNLKKKNRNKIENVKPDKDKKKTKSDKKPQISNFNNVSYSQDVGIDTLYVSERWRDESTGSLEGISNTGGMNPSVSKENVYELIETKPIANVASSPASPSRFSDPSINLVEYSSPSLEKDLETLHNLDLEIEKLESMSLPLSQEDKSPISDSDAMAEAINSDVGSSDNTSVFTFPSNLTLNTDTSTNSKKEIDNIIFKQDADSTTKSADLHILPGVSGLQPEIKEDLPRKISRSPIVAVAAATAGHRADSWDRRAHPSSSLEASPMRQPSSLPSSDQNSLEHENGSSITSTITGVIRRSMRRVKHMRLSGRRSRRRQEEASEETSVRRQLPPAPELGLSSVRSPASSAVLLPSILAAFAPSEAPPREVLPSPLLVTDTQSSEGLSSRVPTIDLALSRSSAPRHRSSPARSTPRGPGRGHVAPDLRQGVLAPPAAVQNPPGQSTSPQRQQTRPQRTSPGVNSNNNRDNSSASANNNNNNSNNNINVRGRSRQANTTNGGRLRSVSRATSVASTLSNNPSSHSSRGTVPRDSFLLMRTSMSFYRRQRWPHALSHVFSSLAIALNTFNISRFTVLGAKYGWPFCVQWLVISLVLGLPLMTFHAALGQASFANVIDMWKISPIFKGVGVSLLLLETYLGIYCCVPISWLFTYLKDSVDFCFHKLVRDIDCRDDIQNLTISRIDNSVSRYFSTYVHVNESVTSFRQEAIRLEPWFNIALIWIITFLALSRGVRTYSKVCYLAILLPLFCYFVFACNFVYQNHTRISMATYKEFFTDKHSWMAASREAFLVWGLHGAVFQQLASSNRRRHPLWRDTTCVFVIASTGLCLAAVIGMIFAEYLGSHGLFYIPSSFETTLSRRFVNDTISDKAKRAIYDNFYVGIRIRQLDDASGFDTLLRHATSPVGYNSVRLLTEIFPTLMVARHPDVRWPWPPIFYIAVLFFGIAHQLAVWHTVVQGLIRFNRHALHRWEMAITFCSCLFALSSSLIMTTGLGMHIVYVLDYVVGSIWWVMILQLLMVFAILFVSGRPFTAPVLARRLFGSGKGRCCSTAWITGPVAFSWTILVPVGLLVLSISSFTTGNYREVFTWVPNRWQCQVASVLQLLPLLLIPLVGFIQTCRYLTDRKKPDLYQRVQHLYRPPMDSYLSERGDAIDDAASSDEILEDLEVSRPTAETPDLRDSSRPLTDPPPKYTPPPSYSTATGVGMQKFFNEGIRRSVRRLRATLLAPSASRRDAETASPARPYIPPPDYTMSRLSSSPTPPTYATLDPIRADRAARRFNGGKMAELARVLAQGSNLGQMETPGPTSSNDAPLFVLGFPARITRSLSQSNSGGRIGPTPLRRSLTSSLRRSARRLALNLNPSPGSSYNRRRRQRQSAHNEIVHCGNDAWRPRSFSNVELSSHSEA